MHCTEILGGGARPLFDSLRDRWIDQPQQHLYHQVADKKPAENPGSVRSRCPIRTRPGVSRWRKRAKERAPIGQGDEPDEMPRRLASWSAT